MVRNHKTKRVAASRLNDQRNALFTIGFTERSAISQKTAPFSHEESVRDLETPNSGRPETHGSRFSHVKLIEEQKNEFDPREAKKALAEMKRRRQKPVSWEKIKKDLGL